MTLVDLHNVCVSLLVNMRGDRRAVLADAVNATAPLVAWERRRDGDPHAQLTHADINRLIEAFAHLRGALAAAGMALCDDGMYVAAWNREGRAPVGLT